MTHLGRRAGYGDGVMAVVEKASAAGPAVALTETQTAVLRVVDAAESQPALHEIAERLGCERSRDLRGYNRIQGALRSLCAKGVLASRKSPAGVRFYYRPAELRASVSDLLARYGAPEAARELVAYASEDDLIWPDVRDACLEAIAEKPDRRRRRTRKTTAGGR